MSDVLVDLDPALCDGLGAEQELAARVHVLQARADDLRGPGRGGRALRLALSASTLEQELLETAGLERGATALREMAEHPATMAAIDRWRYAQRLARQLLAAEPA